MDQGSELQSRRVQAQASADPRPVDWSRVRGTLSAVVLAGVQTGITIAMMFVAGLVVCVVAGPFDHVLTIIGWLLWSAVFAALTTFAVLILGLPLRLVPPLRTWWSENGEYTLLGGLLGVLLMTISFMAGEPGTVTTNDGDLPIFRPQGTLLLIGWVMLAFSCAHVRVPRRWVRAVRLHAGRLWKRMTAADVPSG